MESHIYQSQYERIKINIIQDIQSEMSKLNEKVDFFVTMYIVEPKNPDKFYSIYGIEKDVVLVDSLLTGTEGFYLNEMTLDALIFIKIQLEFYQKSKFISDSI